MSKEDEWICTFTGKKFYPLQPKRNEYCIEDIAHALSLKCRFAGHCKVFYSVAEHCCHVACLVPPHLRLLALMHDAGEAFLPDISKPIKHLVMFDEEESFAFFEEIELDLLEEICMRLNVPWEKPLPEEIKHADLVMLATEARDLMNRKGNQWSLKCEPLSAHFDPEFRWTPSYAEQTFLKTFKGIIQGI